MKYQYIYLIFSAVLVLASLLSIYINGLKLSVDFTGGALLEIEFENKDTIYDVGELRETVQKVEGVNISSAQKVVDSNSYIFKFSEINESTKNEIIKQLGEANSNSAKELRFESVGPTLGRELLIKTLIAVVIASVGIMIFVTYQFKDKIFGLSAIVAMFHDSIILLGAFSVLGKFSIEIDTLFVTAVLTTLSFSVHDTIVVFDRIRESTKLNPRLDIKDVVDKALTETLPRSLNNSMTIIFMLLALTLLGGATIRWFSFALLVGTISGTYSSPFVAAPLFLTLTKKMRKKL